MTPFPLSPRSRAGVDDGTRPTRGRGGRAAGSGGLGRAWTRLAALLLLLATVLALPAAAQTFPRFTGLVVDDAGVLPPDVEADLTAKLEALQKDTRRQLVVVTIGDLQGFPIEEYGYKLGRRWDVGLKDVQNGAILLVAPNNPAGQRGPRIEIARGLQPILTDALSSVIINTDMMPRLKAGDLPGAIAAGTDALIRQLRASPEEAQARLDAAEKGFDADHRRRRGGGGAGGVPLGAIFWVMVVGFVALSLMRRGTTGGGRRYRSAGRGSGLGEVILWGIANEVANNAFRGGGRSDDGGVRGWDGGGGGSWGGGGFTGGGGGGGGFDGGGASGSW